MIQKVVDGVAKIELTQSDIPPTRKNLDLTQFVSYCLQIATMAIEQTWLPDLTNVEIIVDQQAPWPICDVGNQRLDIRKIRIEQADNNKLLEDLVAIVYPDEILFSERGVNIGSMKLIVTDGEIKAILVNI